MEEGEYMNLLYYIEELGSKQIYIYGAGMVARLLAMEIKEETDIIIKAFVVSQLEYPYQLEGRAVLSVNQIDKSVPVVIATLSDFHSSISKTLQEHNIYQYYAVSEEMFQNMRKKYSLEKDEIASTKLRLNEMRKMSDDEEIKGLIISDGNIETIRRLSRKAELVSGKEFLNVEYDIKSPDIIFVLLLDWSGDWRGILKKAFGIGKEIIVSFRYKYMKYDDFSLLNLVKKSGFQLSASKKFHRSSREFSTEDILLKFEKRTPQSLYTDKLCTGCGKCMLECPTGAITMRPDEYGYAKPVCDTDKCVACGKCVNTCPTYIIRKSGADVPACYAYMAEDEIRRNSSSGGVFGVAASGFLQNEGYVCGAAWNQDFSVSHRIIQRIEDLPALQMSKYIRSDITGVLPQMRELLSQQKEILFVGCPCQVEAAKSYLEGFTENLYLIDLLCAEAPSHYIFMKYLTENYEMKDIQEIGFREKSTGWRADSFYVLNKNQEKKMMHMEDLSQKAFHSRMMMAVCCEHCNFLDYPRAGDLTIGDAWGVPKHDPSLNDGKGTSTVIINTEKGRKMYEEIEQDAKKAVPVPFSWTTENRTVDSVKPHMYRDRFYRELKEFGFNKAAEDAYEGMYDIGLVGNWSYPNYGSELTNYALYYVLKSLGYSVLMIEWAEDAEWKPYGVTQLFEDEPYEYSEIAFSVRNHSEFDQYNRQCRMFVQGSDQLLHPFLYQVFGKNAVLDWVDPSKKKIGYALSFGSIPICFEETAKREIAFHLDKFDAVSVRELDAVSFMKKEFSIAAKEVLDPVFLCGQEVYRKLAKRYVLEQGDSILFAYILDPDKKALDVLHDVAHEKDLRLFLASDPAKEECRAQRQNIPLEKWLGNLINSQFVIADSFHGICLSIIFRKEFIAICNEGRGAVRFLSILGQLGLKKRLVWKAEEICHNPILQEKIDYDSVYKILEGKKKESLSWLKENLEKPHTAKYSQDYLIMNERYKTLEKMFYEMKESIKTGK